MKKVRLCKRTMSVFLAVLMAITALFPAFSAFADNGVIDDNCKIKLFYKDTDTAVPVYMDETAAEKEPWIEYMTEGDELKLTYKLIEGSVMPDNAYIKWYSETPTLVDVTQDGVVKAFDSSKGAVIQSWIDNEVKTVPLVGKLMGTALEKALFNDKVNVDEMDTDQIVEVVEAAFGSDSLLSKWVDSYKGQLVDSLRKYLDNINSNIHVTLYSADGKEIADDYVRICVKKCEEWYANFLPNGTHITNKSQINTTVAVGSEVQLYAVTTPVRLKYGVVYSVKSSSIFTNGKAIATVDDSGLVRFKNKGTVTIVVSPDTEQVIEGILKLINYIYALDNTGTIDSGKVADILIKYIGIDIDRNVLAGIIDVCFAVKDVVGDTADPVQLTATAVQVLGNIILKFAYNDTITFNVVDAQPLTDFRIEGVNPDDPDQTETSLLSIKEGSQAQLKITDVKPAAADTSDIVWSSSDPSVASVDPVTGVVTGRDAKGPYGEFSSQECKITATSKANNISRSVTVKITGKTGQYLSDVEIVGPDSMEAPAQADYSFTVYPERVSSSNNLYIEWGILTGEDEEGNPVYTWATADTPAENEIGKIYANGHYETVAGGVCTIAVKARTGYPIGSNNFYEISSYIKTLEVTNGIPVEKITIKPTEVIKPDLYSSELLGPFSVTVGDEEYEYYTVSKNVASMYPRSGAKFEAEVYPQTASNQNIEWVIDNDSYKNPSVDETTHTANIVQNDAGATADYFNVYAQSQDGTVKSNVVTVCVTRNFANANTIDQDSISLTKGKTADATHTMKFNGSWTGEGYACYKCNWYSSDESVFTVENKGNSNSDAVLTGQDVGTATLYCVSADGGIVDTCDITVYPDKEYLQNIVKLCDKTAIKRTTENKELYKDYMQALDLAYYVLYDDPMISQATCDTYADDLLYSLYKLGGFVGITGLEILGPRKTPLDSDHISVKVATLSNYTKSSYDLDYKVAPASAMYSRAIWKSSNEAISVDQNGVCRPLTNEACSAKITCTVKDYMGTETTDSIYIAFVKHPANGVTLDTTEIVGGKIGESQQLTETVLPNKGTSSASCTDVHWKSSDEDIAEVSDTGLVTFKEGGDCVITCITNDGGFTAECKVNVVTNYTALELLIRQYTDLGLMEINYYPDSWAEYQRVLNAAKDMVAQGGYSQKEVNKMRDDLETAYNGLEKYNKIQKIELYLDGNQTSEFYQFDLNILQNGLSYKNAVLDLNVRLFPNNGSYNTVEWESSTPDITVTSDGKCTPTSNKACYGSITCTVTDHFGDSFSDSVWVSYSYRPVVAVEISETNIVGLVGSTHQLTAAVKSDSKLGLKPNITDYFWESEDENVASVDQTGLVTFTGAGSTKVRAVSYDGGIYGECIVSSGGDRSELKKVIDACKDTDYTQYEYSYGVAFKNALDTAQAVLSSETSSQETIDESAANLQNAYDALASHPYINAESISVSYKATAKPLIGSEKVVTSGDVGDNNAVSINLSSDNAQSNNTRNHLTLSASANPAEAMYKSISWKCDADNNMDIEYNASSITFTPKKNSGASATVTATVTDDYDRTISRTLTIVMSDNVCTGFDITQSEKSIYATDEPAQIEYSVSGNPEFKDILWSSDNEEVLSVDSNGVVTPKGSGVAVVTGKTVDGGFTDSITFTVMTDYRTLAQKHTEYTNLINEVKDSYTYTEDSLKALSAVCSEAKTLIDENKATQQQVNEMVQRLDDAYNSLVEYVASTGLSIAYESANEVSEPNEGFIRYSASGLNAKSVKLKLVEEPLGSIYTSCKWESSNNSNVTVDENGLVTNSSNITSLNNSTKITCTITNAFGGEYSKSVYVTFTRNAVTGVSFGEERVMGAPAETADLEPTIAPATASVKDCIFSSNHPEIAQVDENGKVTFITQGEATITATTMDGGYTATITAFTTWDTSALRAAIKEADALLAKTPYTAYQYEYGTRFKNAYDKALEIYDNPYSSQDEIDNACTALTEIMTILPEHTAIAPNPAITQGEQVVANNAKLFVNDNNQVILDYTYAQGAEVKSVEWLAENENGVTTAVSGNSFVITRTIEDTATLTVTLKVTDMWDQETSVELNLSIIDQLIPATAIAITVNGEELENGEITLSSGGRYANFPGATVGYKPYPEKANAITGVSYSLSQSNLAQIDPKTGEISITAAGKLSLQKSFTCKVTCTVTNEDGSTASADALVTITRS